MYIQEYAICLHMQKSVLILRGASPTRYNGGRKGGLHHEDCNGKRPCRNGVEESDQGMAGGPGPRGRGLRHVRRGRVRPFRFRVPGGTGCVEGRVRARHLCGWRGLRQRDDRQQAPWRLRMRVPGPAVRGTRQRAQRRERAVHRRQDHRQRFGDAHRRSLDEHRPADRGEVCPSAGEGCRY